MTRAGIHGAFVAAFHEGRTPVPVEDSAIQRVENELGTVLPQSYVTFMQAHGPVHTPSLLSLIVDGGFEMWDIMVVSEIAEVIDGTKAYWSAGMSEQLIGFASDCMGNLFCFRRTAADITRPDDAEVWLFDHDFCRERKIAGNFDEWLERFVKLKAMA